jgi:2-haloacid dehalogenase
VDLSDFEALSFDCYGTLIDWETGIAAVLGPWAAFAGVDLSDEELLALYAGHEAHVEAEQGGLPYPDVLAASFEAVGLELGAQVSADDARRLAASVPDWPAFSDSHDALTSLGAEYQLIIVSNVDRTSFAGSNARLAVTFDAIVTAEDVGSYKPSPRNFEALLARTAELGIRPDGLLHVAQSLFHDHVPAKAFGLPTVWINRRAERPGWGATPAPAATVTPDWEFRSMADFAEAARRRTRS